MVKKAKDMVRSKFKTKYRIITLVVVLLLSDVYMNINTVISNRVTERDLEITRLELVISENENKIVEHNENEK